MSLSVLVDQEVQWQPDKNSFVKVLVPPSSDKLKVIRDLVAGITGFNAERGDQLIIETLPFENTLLLEPPPGPKPALPGPAKPAIPQLWPIKWDRNTILMASGAVVFVLLLVFAVWRLLRRKAKVTEVSVPTALPEGDTYVPAKAVGAPALETEIESKLAQRDALQHKAEAEALSALKLAPVITKAAEVMAKHLREKIKSEPDVNAQILRTWIREEEES
jgi:flagellar biosynthesis/type III secretory pathway M-ring protein FliF/YscJ